MKKLLSILLATAILFSFSLITVSAENVENKDDNRFDIGEIFGYSYLVTFNDNGNVTTGEFLHESEIIYPALSAVRGEDKVWSLSADEYLPVPQNMPNENISVYSYSFPYVGFESYDKTVCGDSLGVIDISSEYADGDNSKNSLKFSNIASAEDRKYSIALGEATTGTAYKISFKYYIPATLTANYYIDPFTADESINGANDFAVSRFTISENTEAGIWHSGNIYFTAENSNYVYLWLKASSYGNGNVIYFDNFVTTEMDTATFNTADNVIVGDFIGTISNNVITAYYEKGAEITAPVVTVSDGTAVFWVDTFGNDATEFVAGGVYSIKLNAKGDLNEDGAVSTTDLAIIKLFIVEAIGESDINVANGDINGDGKVSVIDMAYLKLYLAGALNKL